MPLPSENRYHSIFACLVSKELSTESNPPMMMTCGHVISKDSLQKLNKSGGYVLSKYPFFPFMLDSRTAVQSALIALLKHRLGQPWGFTCNRAWVTYSTILSYAKAPWVIGTPVVTTCNMILNIYPSQSQISSSTVNFKIRVDHSISPFNPYLMTTASELG
jgi:hypothetical protein